MGNTARDTVERLDAGGPNLTTTDDAIGALFQVPPREFTRARDALAARLTQSRQAAAQVKRLKAPTVPVWVVNRLARAEPKPIQQLIAAADRVRAAQLGRGRDAGSVAAATSDHRKALTVLIERAEQILAEAGIRAFHRLQMRIETTLAAAAAAPEARKALQAGRLERELEPQGFDVFGGAMPSARPRARQPEPKAKGGEEPDRAAAASAEQQRAAAERLERLRRDAKQAALELDQARAAARQSARAAAEAIRAASARKREAERALRAAMRSR